MFFLIGSIFLSTYLAIAFKICDRYGINAFQAIVFNYFTCILTGSIVNGSVPAYAKIIDEPWFVFAVIMGTGFILSFNLIALTVQKNGLAIAAVASKLSLIIPFTASFILYRETAAALKIAGILLALLAVVLTLYPPEYAADKDDTKRRGLNVRIILLPLVVFFATGLLDTLVKYVEQSFLNARNSNDFLITTFTVAFVTGFILLISLVVAGKIKFQLKAVLAGFLIGIPNYFSIWCLMKVLKINPGSSSVIFPVNNMGIVLLSALLAWIVFKEKLSPVNWTGIVLSVVAIIMIAIENLK
jgi:drug/metabolite transporter (DMT)-like permease